MPFVSVDVHAIPTVHTENFSSLISDSGITRYRMNTRIMEVFSKKGDGYWYFPKGIHVEQFDSLFNVVVNITADTAYYFEKKQLWQGIGNVIVRNVEGRIFETSELFWDRTAPLNSTNVFYTYKPVKITQPDGSVMSGLNGFKSDQNLQSINLFSGQGDFNVVESPDSLQQNTARTDSIRRIHE